MSKIDLCKGECLEESVDWSYFKDVKIDGHSLRMYKSTYYGVDIYKQTDSRYDVRSGLSLDKPVKTLFFTDNKGVEFKALGELQDYIRCSV